MSDFNFPSNVDIMIGSDVENAYASLNEIKSNLNPKLFVNFGMDEYSKPATCNQSFIVI